MRANKAVSIAVILSTLLICTVYLQADSEPKKSTGQYDTRDLVEVNTFVPEVRESDISVLAGLEGFGAAVERIPAGIASRELTDKSIKERLISRLGEYGIGILSDEQVQKTQNKPLLAVNIVSISDADKDICAMLFILALKEDIQLTRSQAGATRLLSSRGIIWQRSEIKLCRIEQAADTVKAAVDYMAGVFAREFLAANPNFKKIEKGDENMIPGTVQHIGIEGGFYGLVADSGEKYDPVNLPDEFKKDGLRVRFAVKEKQGVASFHMWGKIVDVLKIERADKTTNAVTLQWFGHASFKISSGNTNIYIDPWKLSEAKHDASIVLVSHSHYDHYSPGDIKKVSKDGDTQLISSLDVIEKEGWGHVIKPAHVVEVKGIKITAVAAYNPAKQYHPRNNEWLGFLIDIGGIRIYYAGDTDITAEMKALRGVDVALLPIGGTYTMDADQAAQAVKFFKPKKAIPYHWGDIVGSKDDANKFASQAECGVIVMTPGEIKKLSD
jgi:L-ascorbate metabolism protein UlaG (beta-lactamase superfamily)